MKCVPDEIPNGHKRSVQRELHNLHNRVDSYIHVILLTGNQKAPFNGNIAVLLSDLNGFYAQKGYRYCIRLL